MMMMSLYSMNSCPVLPFEVLRQSNLSSWNWQNKESAEVKWGFIVLIILMMIAKIVIMIGIIIGFAPFAPPHPFAIIGHHPPPPHN